MFYSSLLLSYYMEIKITPVNLHFYTMFIETGSRPKIGLLKRLPKSKYQKLTDMEIDRGQKLIYDPS